MAFQLCPICLKEFAQLSQHLRVTHQIINVEERRLLLALDSGRISFRVGCCPIIGCGKDTMRLDRHLKRHRKLSQKALQNIVMEWKKKKIMSQLAALRASNPRTPMNSTLDLKDDNVKDDHVKEDDVKADHVKAGDVKAGDVKAGDVKAGDVKAGDVKAGDVKAGDVKEDDIKEDDVKDDHVKEDDVKAGDVKEDDVKDDHVKDDNVKAEDPGMPEVPMAEEELCCLESCRRKKLQLKLEVNDLNKQLSTLASSLTTVTQRYSALKRQCGREVSEAIEDNALPMSPTPQDSSITSQQSYDQLEPSSSPHHPDQLLPLNEQDESPVPMPKLRKIMGEKMLPEDIKFASISHASQGLVMLRPLKQLKLRASHCSFAQVSPIKRANSRAEAKFIVNKALKDSSFPRPQ
ncbi:uncharacterized protein [Misgurnus anguillicaudatus]|uniref:uncharacterized protein n=1 Tax=Misgurnus anguillicaudatus TaxID=75329 RepID=UPI003CCF0773